MNIEVEGRSYPLVEAIRDQSGVHLEFKCPWCKRIHRHGATSSAIFGKGDGLRVSHCPLYEGDYFVREVSQ